MKSTLFFIAGGVVATAVTTRVIVGIAPEAFSRALGEKIAEGAERVRDKVFGINRRGAISC